MNAPPVVLRPYNVSCGPFRTSTRSISTKLSTSEPKVSPDVDVVDIDADRLIDAGRLIILQLTAKADGRAQRTGGIGLDDQTRRALLDRRYIVEILATEITRGERRYRDGRPLQPLR